MAVRAYKYPYMYIGMGPASGANETNATILFKIPRNELENKGGYEEERGDAGRDP